MVHGPGFMMVRGFRMDPSITKQKLKPGTVRRIAAYARPYRAHLAIFLLATCVDAAITVIRRTPDHGAPFATAGDALLYDPQTGPHAPTAQAAPAAPSAQYATDMRERACPPSRSTSSTKAIA